MKPNTDEYFMRIALEEAKKGKETTHPNPMVGVVIVEEDKIVARGFHVRPGDLHAERIAINVLGRKPAANARMYVTLEPCSTVGRTGKCTDAIIEAGILNVIVGAIDPNPDHQGKGIEILRQKGINVQTGILEEECLQLNQDFNKRMSGLRKKST